jgi:hypothetical protein
MIKFSYQLFFESAKFIKKTAPPQEVKGVIEETYKQKVT